MAKDFSKLVRDEVAKGVRAINKRIKRRVQHNVSGGVVQRRTGQARRSIFARTRKRKDGVKSQLGYDASRAFYVRFFETGTKAFTIRLPIRRRSGKVIRALKIGEDFVRGSVQVPAKRKTPVFQPAVDRELKDRREIESALANLAAEHLPRRIRG